MAPADLDLRDAIDRFDRAFAAGDAEAFFETFVSDARVLIHQEEALEGIEAIRSSFGPLFEAIDTSEYRARYEVVDTHGDRGYVLSSFDEVLRPRDGTAGIRVRGRAVHFWLREGEEWRIRILLTSRSGPDEPA